MTRSGAMANPDQGERHCFVVGFDFCESAEVALDQALALIGALPTATLHVVWVPPLREPGEPPRGPLLAGPRDLGAASEALRDYVAARVRFVANRLGPNTTYGGSQVCVHVLPGSPARVLNDVAFRQGAHMIVVGSLGRAGLERVVLGSVAADVLATAPCPVVIARPRALDQLPRKRSRIPDALAIRSAVGGGAAQARLQGPLADTDPEIPRPLIVPLH